MEFEGFYDHLLTFYMKRDISNVNHQNIPLTEPKQDIIDALKSSLQLFLEEFY